MNEAYLAGMAEVLDGLAAAKADLRGVIVTSAKKTFFAGGDLETLIRYGPDDAAAAFDARHPDQGAAAPAGDPRPAGGRRGERHRARRRPGDRAGLPPPHRASTRPGVVYGLPEVTLGLLPGAGGVTRITRMLGIADGFMKVLVQGQRHKPAAALEIGIVDELVGDPGGGARRAPGPGSRSNPQARQPWDTPGYQIPGGTPEPRRSSPPSCRRSRRTCASSSRAPRCPRRATSWPRPSRAPRSTSTPRCASRPGTSSTWSPGRSPRT